MKSNVVLLLTGCINPNGMSCTKVSDVETRLKQYLKALKYYTQRLDCQIVFVENSNFDITPYFERFHINATKLEVLCFDGNEYDKSVGKGFGEALIIEYALNHSEYLSCADMIIKITGRIIFNDIVEIVQEVSLASLNTIFADINWHRDYQDKILSVIVAAAPSFWIRFVSKKENIDDRTGKVFEVVLKETVDEWLLDKGRFSLFHTPLLYKGVSGSTGLSYARSHPLVKYYLKLFYFNLYLRYIMFK